MYVVEKAMLSNPGIEWTFELLTAEREQVRKTHNMNFRNLGILLLHVDGENSV
jgi:hypothetical protein